MPGVSEMPEKRYEVRLTEEERVELRKRVTMGTSTAREIMHAKVLLSTDDGRAPKMTVRAVAERCETTTATVQTIRKTYVEQGIEAALSRKKREKPPIAAKITGEVEAHIIATACSAPPPGQSKWSLRLLAEKVVELEYIESISYVSVRSVLKKHNLSLT